jgi:hypothetical protein
MLERKPEQVVQTKSHYMVQMLGVSFHSRKQIQQDLERADTFNTKQMSLSLLEMYTIAQ